MVAQHRRYWDAIVAAVESADFEELMQFARHAGRFQFSEGLDLSDAVKRTVEATNMIELALLEANNGEIPPLTIINEIAELRSTIVMAVAEGYKLAQDESAKDVSRETASKERLRATLERRRSDYATVRLTSGDEIGPLYDQGKRFHFVVSGKLRLYNLLPNGRCITLSILGENDVFMQWRADTGGLSCLCAEAMQSAEVISLSEAEMAEVIASQPSAGVDVIASFVQRLTESQVLIEDLMNNSVNLRLYRTLLELGKQFGRPEGEGFVIDVPLTHQRLADMIGSNRVTVTRKLHELQERGIVEALKSASIAVRKPALLARLAAEGASE